jgi:hypothetical protein
MFLFSSFQQNISVFAAVIFGKKWVTDSCLTHGRYALTGTVGGAEGAAAPPPPPPPLTVDVSLYQNSPLLGLKSLLPPLPRI